MNKLYVQSNPSGLLFLLSINKFGFIQDFNRNQVIITVFQKDFLFLTINKDKSEWNKCGFT